MKRTPLKRKTPLKSGGPLARTCAPAPNAALARRSGRKADEAGQLHAVYEWIARTRPQVCAGCGRPAGGAVKLSHSHLVPRSYNQALICQPDNIAYHCLDWMGREGCHTKHESNAKRHALLDFEKNMAYIERADPAYYRLLLAKTVRP